MKIFSTEPKNHSGTKQKQQCATRIFTLLFCLNAFGFATLFGQTQSFTDFGRASGGTDFEYSISPVSFSPIGDSTGLFVTSTDATFPQIGMGGNAVSAAFTSSPVTTSGRYAVSLEGNFTLAFLGTASSASSINLPTTAEEVRNLNSLSSPVIIELTAGEYLLLGYDILNAPGDLDAADLWTGSSLTLVYQPVAQTITQVDLAAQQQLTSHALPMNLLLGQVAGNLHSLSGRSLNKRLHRLRSRSIQSRESQASFFAGRQARIESSTSISLNSYSGETTVPQNSSLAAQVEWPNLLPTTTLTANEIVAPDVVAQGNSWQAFASADFGHYDLDQLNSHPELESNTYASTLGIELSIDQAWTAGLGWSHVWNDNTMGNQLGSVDIEGDAIMAYASYFKDNFWGDLLYSYGAYGADIDRNTTLGTSVHADPDIDSHQTSLNLGYNIPTARRLTHGPTFRTDYSWGHIDGYTETGDIRANTTFQEQQYESLITALGWQVNWETELSFATARPNIRLGYGRENLAQSSNTNGTLQQSPVTFVNSATGAITGRGAAVSNQISHNHSPEGWMELGAGINFEINQKLNLYLDYQGRLFQQDSQLHMGSIKAGWSW